MTESDHSGPSIHPNEEMARTPIDASSSGLATSISTGYPLYSLELSDRDFFYGGTQGYGVSRFPKDASQRTSLGANPTYIWSMVRDGGGDTGRIPVLYMADYQTDKVWRLPLDQETNTEARSIATLHNATCVSVTTDGLNAAVTNRDGQLFWMDLETGYPGNAPVVTGLGTSTSVALDNVHRPNAYVVDQAAGVLWKVSTETGEKVVFAKGMTSPYHVFLRHNSGAENAYTYAYVICGNGDLWRIPVEGQTVAGAAVGGMTVSRDRDLAVYNLGNATDVKIDKEGVAYITNSGGQIWTVKEVDNPTQDGVAAPVITAPVNGHETGPTPYFTGTAKVPAGGGYTIHAREADTVIADGVPISADGKWDFVRRAEAGPWVPGNHPVTVSIRKDGKDVAAATVTFATRGLAVPGPNFLTPKGYATTGATPWFTGNVPVSLATGTTVHAVDETGAVLALDGAVDAKGEWGFSRPGSLGPWTEGWHSIEVCVRRGGAPITGTNSLTFKVKH